VSWLESHSSKSSLLRSPDGPRFDTVLHPPRVVIALPVAGDLAYDMRYRLLSVRGRVYRSYC
jgi:hypothetical protein